MFFALLIQKQIKKKKVKHTQKNSQIKSNLLFYFHQLDGKRWPCHSLPPSFTRSQFVFSIFFVNATATAAASAAADVRFVLCSAPKQGDTANDTLEYDDINDNRREGGGKK